jgi:polysaccharide export outer membrane protein
MESRYSFYKKKQLGLGLSGFSSSVHSSMRKSGDIGSNLPGRPHTANLRPIQTILEYGWKQRRPFDHDWLSLRPSGKHNQAQKFAGRTGILLVLSTSIRTLGSRLMNLRIAYKSAIYVFFLIIIPLSSPAQSEDASQPAAYLINAGDQLEVSVWKEPDLQRTVLVRPDGGFSFPLAGNIQAKGRTAEEIATELRSRLLRYIPEIVLTVTVTDVSGNQIYVIGQVERPGAFVMNPVIDVIQALTLAGGTTPFASVRNIRILRRENGVQRTMGFDYKEVSEGRSLEQNILLKSGDVVVVP